MKALVLGGTGFMGRRLVQELLSNGYEVTMATSGKSPNPFGDKVETLVTNRFNEENLNKTLSSITYQDVVFDTIGYRSLDMKYALDAIGNRAGKYVYISSGSVYDGMDGILSETRFNSHGMEVAPALETNYSDGKKMSEAYLLKNASMPVAIVRFPVVIGFDDSTMRFQKQVLKILSGEEITFQEPEGRRNYIWVEDAGRFLYWIGNEKIKGIFNAASPDSIRPSELVRKMYAALGKTARVKMVQKESNSIYKASGIRILNVEKAENYGFMFTPTEQWIGPETVKASESGLNAPNSYEYTDVLFPWSSDAVKSKK